MVPLKPQIYSEYAEDFYTIEPRCVFLLSNDDDDDDDDYDDDHDDKFIGPCDIYDDRPLFLLSQLDRQIDKQTDTDMQTDRQTDGRTLAKFI